MKNYKKLFAFITAAVMITSGSAGVSAASLRTIDGYKYICNEGGNAFLYTGWAKVNGLYRYYSEGKRCIGWHKINGSYYYLTRNGGIAAGLYRIGNTVYEFDNSGKYTGKKHAPSEYENIMNNPSAVQWDIYSRLLNYIETGTDSAGNTVYAEDYGGIVWDSKKMQYKVYLTSDKNIDIYNDIQGDSDSLYFELTNVSYNDLWELHRYISKNWHDDLSEFGIVGFGIGYNRLDISIGGGEEIADDLCEYLISKGFAEEMFTIETDVTIVAL